MASGFAQWGNDLYTGRRSYAIVAKRRAYFVVALVLVVLSLGIIGVRIAGDGLNLGIEFRGGSEFTVSGVSDTSQQRALDAVAAVAPEEVPRVTSVGSSTVRVQTAELSNAQVEQVAVELANAYDVSEGEVTSSYIGPTWGKDVSQKAIVGLVVFLLLVSLVMTIYFRNWRMALAAVIALFHDLIVTVGIYAAIGWEITPATVIGLLTILAYSIYDTVVVFDKVRENTAGVLDQTRSTYAERANLAINQTLVRSINTSVVAGCSPSQASSSSGRSCWARARCATSRSRSSSAWPSAPTRRCTSRRRSRSRCASGRSPSRSTRPRSSRCARSGPRSRATRRTPRSRRPASGQGTASSRPGQAPREAGAAAPPDDGTRSRAGRRGGRPARRPPRRARPGARLARVLELVRAVPDYPGPGIVFRDITGLLADGDAFGHVVEALGDVARAAGGVDLVAGMEARGFLIGAPLATHLGVGFVPLRKAGKLPPPTDTVTYDLEYGTATIELRSGTLPPGARVLVVDDVLATGGTAAAGAELVERGGGVVVGLAFLLELEGLGGRERLAGREVATLVHVES